MRQLPVAWDEVVVLAGYSSFLLLTTGLSQISLNMAEKVMIIEVPKFIPL